MLVAVQDSGHPFQSDGWRLGGTPSPTVVELDETLLVDRAAGTVPVDQSATRSGSCRPRTTSRCLSIDGRREVAGRQRPGAHAEVAYRGQRFVFESPTCSPTTAGRRRRVGVGTDARHRADVRVAAGDVVAEGDVLGVVEAMKMELALKAPFAGTVTDVTPRSATRSRWGIRLFS
jgi:hypothetical protein